MISKDENGIIVSYMHHPLSTLIGSRVDIINAENPSVIIKAVVKQMLDCGGAVCAPSDEGSMIFILSTALEVWTWNTVVAICHHEAGHIKADFMERANAAIPVGFVGTYIYVDADEEIMADNNAVLQGYGLELLSGLESMEATVRLMAKALRPDKIKDTRFIAEPETNQVFLKRIENLKNQLGIL